MGVEAERIDRLRAEASRLLLANSRSGYDRRLKTEYRFVAPSQRKYPWQWFWDSCFHAIALSHIDVELAKRELETLVAGQDEDGFIGHITFWEGASNLTVWNRFQSKLSLSPLHTALIQPPLLAQAVDRVVSASGDLQFLGTVYPKVARYYDWLSTHRDPDGDGLISIISNYESGTDYSPVFDGVLGVPGFTDPRWLRPNSHRLDVMNAICGRNYNLDVIFRADRFNVEDILVNCVYAEGLHTLAALAELAGFHDRAPHYRQLAAQAEQAIVEKCYDPSADAFFSLSGRAEGKLDVLTAASLFPLLLNGLPAERADSLVASLTDSHRFWPRYPVPSVAVCEPAFRPGEFRTLLWRGPTWMGVNWAIARGLRRHRLTDLADELTERSVALVEMSGFREYYNPFTGEGLGERDFTWSTLVLDMLAG